MNCKKSARREKTYKKILLIGLLISLIGCSEPIASRSDIALGTFCTITLYEHGKPRLYDEIFKRIFEIEALMSVHITESELHRINEAAGITPVKVSAEVFDIIERALYFAEVSYSAFNPAIGPIVLLWDIGGEAQRIPSQDEIDNLLPLLDWRDIELERENSTIFLTRHGMALDLGAIAKGFAADEAARIIQEAWGLLPQQQQSQQSQRQPADFPRAIIDLGGNILVLGEKPDSSPWTIGIQDPLDSREIIGYVSINQKANEQKTIVTSGIYQRYFIEEEVLYHHIFSFDGFPVINNLLSVTIITDNSIDADALSTAVFVMGYEQGRVLVQALEGVSCIYVFDDQLIRITGDVDFVLTNSDYRIAND